ncbi:hypothetical protein B0H65DRAFT_462367 [Neurospora tetraspora]|uniref:THUMP domain-containing protein n=1 Tax=Neurospora tetraspora TaxID=94610 RepID=A0AAE0JHP8_9PEZI|nr:hypothetical protein B0H65DRAFT_462367 [Neurospora tetraspora]
MGGDKGKRKDAPGGAGGQKQKKKKTGSGGKWTTPNQANKLALERNSIPQIGDRGIWVTCARHQENKAAREVINLFEEYIETMYGIKPASKEPKVEDDDDAELDIEAAIAKELGAMKEKKTADVQKQEDDKALLKAMKLNIDCLLFVRTKSPIEPVEFVKRIVVDTKECTDIRKIKCRYLNRLTPMSVMGKATEQGLAETARQVLEEYFDLSGKKGEQKEEDGAEVKKEGENKEQKEYKPYTYAIRPTIRNHSNLKRDVVINTIAGLINDERHKVNLTNPDKVILVDIFQTVCGLSVVDGDWDELKKYNMTELYNQAAGITAVGKKDKQEKQDEKKPKSAKKEEETKDIKEEEPKIKEEEPASTDA